MQWKDTDNVKAVARRNGKKQTSWKEQLDAMKDTDKVKGVARRNGKKQTRWKQQLVAMERHTQDESGS